jgi:hypothetical protein
MPPETIAAARQALTAAIAAYTSTVSPVTANHLAQARQVYEAVTGTRLIPDSPAWTRLIEEALD